MKLLMVYNFASEESSIEAPNFYKACAEHIFSVHGMETTFLPDLRVSRTFRLLSKLGFSDSVTMTFIVMWWMSRNGHKYDVILGWVTNGIISACLKYFLRWPRTHVCLILYKLPDASMYGAMPTVKRSVINIASHGADLLMALDSLQAKAFAKTLARKPGTTLSLLYGVDAVWYEGICKNIPHRIEPLSIICPGGAYRDEVTLERAVEDLDVRVKRFRLNLNENQSIISKKVGRAYVEYICNAPYEDYIKECCSSALVIISVANSDKPVGLTSLLECMALGCSVIITRGASSRDYVKDGVTALLYDEGNWQELQDKIKYLIENPVIARQIGEAARISAHNEYGLETCGQHFLRNLYELGVKNA